MAIAEKGRLRFSASVADANGKKPRFLLSSGKRGFFAAVTADGENSDNESGTSSRRVDKNLVVF
ncbi:hypothetical protein CDO73_12005 [Saccharibacillus sp. O23]|nr:hypothetical protein CDO73_12005 [Saccharibacillus sp. O23]